MAKLLFMIFKKAFLSSVLSIAVSLCCLAQDIASLGKSSAITTGKLPNGISWYVASSTSHKGFADFALIQNDAINPEASSNLLSNLPHLEDKAAYKFFTDKGVSYNRQGFVQHVSNHTIYRFNDVPVSSQAVTDSTLLLLMDIASSSESPQAIVVSGDVSAATIKDRLGLVSLQVNTRKGKASESDYVWEPVEDRRMGVIAGRSDRIATINLVYASSRTAKDQMSTVVPLIMEVYAQALGHVVGERLEKVLHSLDIPVASYSFNHRGSAEADGDELYAFSFTTSADRAEDALRVAASVLSSLDRSGVGKYEYIYAKDAVLSILENEDATKGSLADKCISSFMYGSSLASGIDKRNMLVSKAVDSDREKVLFNDFVSALIDREQNLSISVSSSASMPSTDRLSRVFDEGWEDGAKYVPEPDVPLVFRTVPYTSTEKIKLKTTGKEPVTGGSLWTFSNGIKVIYKYVGGTREFDYAFLVKGGYASVKGLGMGEGAYVSDMLSFYGVGGLSASEFRNYLSTKDISMDWSVNLSDMRISGRAPKEELQTVLDVILTMAKDRKMEEEGFSIYKSARQVSYEASRLKPEGLRAVMDSLICPDFLYTDRKYPDNLKDDLQKRADEYFKNQFSRFNDGVIVIVGDLDEASLKKTLVKYLGELPTGAALSTRPIVDFRMRSGSSTYTIGSEKMDPGHAEVNVAYSAKELFSLEKRFAFDVALEALSRELSRNLADFGMYASIDASFDLLPVERMFMFISLKPCEPSGLPEGIFPSAPVEVMSVVRQTVASLVEKGISKDDLKVYKASLLNNYESLLKDNSSLIDMAMVRYSLGKDLVSGYKDKINGVDSKAVVNILKALEEGGIVEYIIR